MHPGSAVAVFMQFVNITQLPPQVSMVIMFITRARLPGNEYTQLIAETH